MRRLLSHARTRPVLFSIVGVAVALMVVWLVWISLTLLEQSQRNATIARDARAAAIAILDCTDPDGDCFQQSERRYATAVSGINAGTLRIIAAALSCQADGVTDQKALAECTTKRAARSE